MAWLEVWLGRGIACDSFSAAPAVSNASAASAASLTAGDQGVTWCSKLPYITRSLKHREYFISSGAGIRGLVGRSPMPLRIWSVLGERSTEEMSVGEKNLRKTRAKAGDKLGHVELINHKSKKGAYMFSPLL